MKALLCIAGALALAGSVVVAWPGVPAPGPGTAPPPNFGALRQAIADLAGSFGERYPGAQGYLERLAQLELEAGDPAAGTAVRAQFVALQREALLANPLLEFPGLLVVKRRPAGKGPDRFGFPSNHECNSSLPRTGYDNELAVLTPIGPGGKGKWRTLHRPAQGGYVGEVDLHWVADRLLFTQSDSAHWQIWEVRIDGSGLRRVSQLPADVDCFDACYLPSGQIVFGSTASYQAVPCWHGQKWVSNLYLMNADGSGVRQLCFDQDHDFHPVVLANGQVLYHRWDYTGINHIFLRQLMVMNPDGTGQRAVYGSGSWFPNALYFPKPLPGESSRLLCILSGYHGVHRMGQLVLLDTSRGWREADGMVARISGRGDPIRPMIRDELVDADWPKFLHPHPLSANYCLVAGQPHPGALWGIYLADVFDNLVLVREDPGYALFEPVPIRKTVRPPVLPDRVELSRTDPVVYVHNIYAGPGLGGVPRGVVQRLRVVAYHFGYRHLAGPDKVGYGGPWEVMRILGTVPIERDGSALFCVPAGTPLALQALDAEGKAVQLMRSWFTAQPGEYVSCAGCHESPAEVALPTVSVAAQRPPRELISWYGPARGFSFAREVQPVLNRHCVSCHDGQHAPLDLRPTEAVVDYAGRRISDLGVQRLHPQMRADTQGALRYAPAYDALLPYVRRVGIEDDVRLLVPGEYHADRSPLIQLLRKGHGGVRLDTEAWDRLATWIDLNAPCHGTWGEVYPIPEGSHQRRMVLRRLHAGPADDPEVVPPLDPIDSSPLPPQPVPKADPVRLGGWPLDAEAAQRRQAALGPAEEVLDLGNGVRMRLVRVPAGEFVMGSAEGDPDERPLTRVAIRAPFWMGACEVSNEQYRQFDPTHSPGYYAKRHARSDDQGLPLDAPSQPVVRVAWEEALAFCRWLSTRTGRQFTLPTEAQWEYACRAGTATALAFGTLDADPSTWANVADRSLSRGWRADGKQVTGGLEHLVLEGAELSDTRYQDGSVVTSPIGSFRPNAWGLHDLHGNAAEWTLSVYQPYPYRLDTRPRFATAGEPTAGAPDLRRAVRGGSFFDPLARCRSAVRLAYPPWQRVFNVGFRVVCPDEPADLAHRIP